MSFSTAYHEAVQDRNKKAFLDLLNNSMPFASKDGNLEVAILDRARQRSSRWRSWWEIRDNQWWIEHANQRLVGLPEVVFDFDPEPGETRAEFLARVQDQTKEHTGDGRLLGVFETGSRGAHVHVLVPALVDHPRRELVKKWLLKRAGADTQKAADRTMIAMENSEHWKTGKPKRCVSW